MKTFEYLCTLLLLDEKGNFFMQYNDNPILNYPSLTAPLDFLGSKGWELITYTRYHTSEVVNGVECKWAYECFFKREKS